MTQEASGVDRPVVVDGVTVTVVVSGISVALVDVSVPDGLQLSASREYKNHYTIRSYTHLGSFLQHTNAEGDQWLVLWIIYSDTSIDVTLEAISGFISMT